MTRKAYPKTGRCKLPFVSLPRDRGRTFVLSSPRTCVTVPKPTSDGCWAHWILPATSGSRRAARAVSGACQPSLRAFLCVCHLFLVLQRRIARRRAIAVLASALAIGAICVVSVLVAKRGSPLPGPPALLDPSTSHSKVPRSTHVTPKASPPSVVCAVRAVRGTHHQAQRECRGGGCAVASVRLGQRGRW